MNSKLLFLPFAFIIFLASCTDPANDPGTDDRDALIGNWVTTESSAQFGSSSYTISISKSNSDDNQIIIKNFYNLGSSTNTIASVSGKSISISSQQVSSHTVSGSGSLSGSKISWSYTTNDGVQADNCTASSTK